MDSPTSAQSSKGLYTDSSPQAQPAAYQLLYPAVISFAAPWLTFSIQQQQQRR